MDLAKIIPEKHRFRKDGLAKKGLEYCLSYLAA